MMVERLFLAAPRDCLQFGIVVFSDHTHYFSCKLTISCTSGRRFGASGVHLGLPVAWAVVPSGAQVLLLLTFLFIVTPIVGVCNCSMFCCTLLCVHSSFAIILMGMRELVALLSLSSWCLVMVVWLFLAVPWVCLRFVIVEFPDHTQLLFFSRLRLNHSENKGFHTSIFSLS